jgi:hypothetical protein
MNTDYPYLFEQIILAAWQKYSQGADPHGLADSAVIDVLGEILSGEEGHKAKFALSAALKKVAAEREGTAVAPMLLKLDKKVWEAKRTDDLYPILDKTKTLFESVGIILV